MCKIDIVILVQVTLLESTRTAFKMYLRGNPLPSLVSCFFPLWTIKMSARIFLNALKVPFYLSPFFWFFSNPLYFGHRQLQLLLSQLQWPYSLSHWNLVLCTSPVRNCPWQGRREYKTIKVKCSIKLGLEVKAHRWRAVLLNGQPILARSNL